VTLGRPVAVAIQVMDADGSGVIELRGARDVEWSPDGTRLVTTDPWDVHLPGSYPAVRVLDPAHGSDVEVGAGLFPHWYAGDVVSYYRAIGETASSPGEPTIFLHAADGSGEEDVLITGQREAVPTPDHDRLAYVGGDGTCGVPCSRLTLADGAGEYVIGDAWSPAWSRDGQTIAYLVGEDAHVGLYDASAGERTLAAVATSIAWAPYGGRLALEVENPYLTAVQVIDTVTGSELVVTLGASPSWVSQP
jgi:Tol biopolymer transport system component